MLRAMQTIIIIIIRETRAGLQVVKTT